MIEKKQETEKDNYVWYACYTHPKSEKKVDERLKEEGFTSFLPQITVIKQWSDRKKKVQIPLIPSIIFVNIEPLELSNVLKVYGVSNVVRYLGKPAIIRDFEIENLKIITEHKPEFQNVTGLQFEKGSIVRVTKGQLIGLIGTSVRHQGKHRVLIELEGIDSKLLIEIPASHLEKI